MVMAMKATPRAVLHGIRDESPRRLPAETRSLPQHLPIFFLLTEKSEEINIVGENAASTIYGDNTFNASSPFYNHQSVGAEVALNARNQIMVVPIKMDNATKATIRIGAEIVPATVNGKNVSRIVWHADPIDNSGTEPFREAQVNPMFRQGNFTSEITGEKLGALVEGGKEYFTPSAYYPIFDMEVESRGSYGNNFAFSIDTPIETSQHPPDTRMYTIYNQFVYRLSLYQKSAPSVNPRLIFNQYSETVSDFVLEPDFVHPNTNLNMTFGNVITKYYEDTDNPEKPAVYSPFPRVATYQDNLEELCRTLATSYEVEAVAEDGESHTFEIKGIYDDPEEAKRKMFTVNILTGHDITGKKYDTADFESSRKFGGIRFGKDSIIYAQGGSDGFPMLLGSVDKARLLQLFDERVRQWCEDFTELNPLYDSAKYPFSNTWDTGFSIATKRALTKPVGQHKRLWTCLSTHSIADYADTVNMTGWHYRPALNGAEEISVGMMLKTYALLTPESEEFGTPTVRIAICSRSGFMHNDRLRQRLPLTIELIHKVAKYCGAGDAIWVNAEAFDVYPKNRVELFKQDSINITYQSNSVYNKAWDAGIMWVQNSDTNACFFPAFRTVYPDDTSVLTSFINMLACCYLERVAEKVWRRLVGNGKLTDDEFLEESDKMIAEEVNGKFDDRYKIVPHTFYTSTDKLLGFQWSTEIHIYANNMKTVGKFTIVAKRMSDYQPTA